MEKKYMKQKKLLIAALLLSLVALAFYFATRQREIIINLEPVGNDVGEYFGEKI